MIIVYILMCDVRQRDLSVQFCASICMSVQPDKELTNTSQYKCARKPRIRTNFSQQKIDSSLVVAEKPEVGSLSTVRYRQVTSTYGGSGNLS